MNEYTVVINDCATPAAHGIKSVRTRDTEYGARNFALRLDDVAGGLPGQLTEHQMDWLEILGALFAIDMACDRGHGDVQWAREISAWIPVRDPGYWERFRPDFERIWTRLTYDDLDVHFELDRDPALAPRQSRAPFPDHQSVALLSGGQDSFAGALELLDQGNRPLLLSHTASGATNTAQVNVEAILKSIDPKVRRIRVGAGRTGDHPFPGEEASQRSRTFFFVGVASLMAHLGGSNSVYLNENGIMAVHLPLTSARIGSLSTHTASPPIVAEIESLARAALSAPLLEISNLLVTLTKPEVVDVAVRLGQGPNMQQTVSCWQIGRSRTHCGFCAPCIIRRISCETHGIADVPYDHDVFDDVSAIDDVRARDNLAHFVGLIDDILELSDAELEYEYPELLNGSPAMTLDQTISLHWRWAAQADSVLTSHSVPATLR